MDAAQTQMNVRLNAERKARGDEVLAGFGLTPTQAVRSLWDYLATRKALPEFMAADTEGDESEQYSPQSLSETGAGMAVRLAREAGLHCDALLSLPYEELREAAYDERFEEWEHSGV